MSKPGKNRTPQELLRGLGAALLVNLCLASVSGAEEDLVGRWSGDYSCGGSRGAMVLDVQKAGGGLDGVFSFETGGRKGSYRLSGQSGTDRRFAFVPSGWIERPLNFRALGLSGAVNANGLLIEGRMPGCAMSSFKAAREAAGQALPAADPVLPPQGPLNGLWSGRIECRSNRGRIMGFVDVDLQLVSDEDGFGAAARLKVAADPRSQEHVEAAVLMSGERRGGQLRTTGTKPIDAAADRLQLRSMDISEAGEGRLEGSLRMAGCQTLSLDRLADAAPIPFPPGAEGVWIGTGGQQNDTAVELHVVNDGPLPFAELRASRPAGRPYAERDRLRLLLGPMEDRSGRVLLAPVLYREATGTFAGMTRNLHGFVGDFSQEGAVAFHFDVVARRLREMMEGGGMPPRSPTSFLLLPPSEGMAERLRDGEAPPLDLAGLGGALGRAPSREAQCRTLAEWLQPFADEAGSGNMSVGHVLDELAPAFAGEAFETVFGVSLLQTSHESRQAVVRLIRSTCARAADMRLVGIVGDYAFSEAAFGRLTARLADRSEAGRWAQGAATEIAGLPEDMDSLGRLEEIGRELHSRRNDISPRVAEDIRAELAAREVGIKLTDLGNRLEALPDTGFEEGALDLVLRLMDELARPEFGAIDRQALRARAEEKARAILEEPLQKAAAVASMLPMAPDGLKAGRAALAPFANYWDRMGTHFATLDRHRTLAPLHDRLQRIASDRGVQTALKDILTNVEGVPDPRTSVMNTAALYVNTRNLHFMPEIEALVEEAVDIVELRSLVVLDLSGHTAEGEPSAEDIALIAMQRIRTVNERMRAAEAACLSGNIVDNVQALGCLMQPSMVTGQAGFGARLQEVRKIGCETLVENAQYRCIFTQRISINLPGAGAFGVGSLPAMVEDLSGEEPQSARFLRAAGGGWNVVWERDV